MTRTKKLKRKALKRLAPKLCPIHGTTLKYSPNRYGSHWNCPEAGCTVRCWGGDTSLPGDKETFDERKKTHAAFDPLWRNKIAFAHIGRAYMWLAEVMEMPQKDAHIGMFTAEQCRRARMHVNVLIAGLQEVHH